MDYVEIDLDRPRKLKFNFRALRDLEQRTGGLSFSEIVAKLQMLHLSTVVVVLYVGLRSEDAKLTPLRTEDLVVEYLAKGGTVGELSEAVALALNRSGVFGRRSDNADTAEGDGAAGPRGAASASG